MAFWQNPHGKGVTCKILTTMDLGDQVLGLRSQVLGLRSQARAPSSQLQALRNNRVRPLPLYAGILES